MSTCNCDVCQRNKTFCARLAWLPEPQRAYWDSLGEDLLHLQMDVDYYKAIMNGQWPSGKEVLLQALEKYKDES